MTRKRSEPTVKVAPSVVLDASAMLAVLRREPGADVVIPHLRGAKISAVNCAEVLQKSVEIGVSADSLLRIMDDLDVHVIDFTLEHSKLCASLHGPTRSAGLSLGDRACIALGILEDSRVLTADRRWNHPAVKANLSFIR